MIAMSDSDRNPTGLHGSVDLSKRQSVGSQTLSNARAVGAQQAAHDVGVDLKSLTDAVADIDVDRMGSTTEPAPRMQTLSQDKYTTSGSLVNPKVA